MHFHIWAVINKLKIRRVDSFHTFPRRIFTSAPRTREYSRIGATQNAFRMEAGRFEHGANSSLKDLTLSVNSRGDVGQMPDFAPDDLQIFIFDIHLPTYLPADLPKTLFLHPPSYHIGTISGIFVIRIIQSRKENLKIIYVIFMRGFLISSTHLSPVRERIMNWKGLTGVWLTRTEGMKKKKKKKRSTHGMPP